MNILLILAPYGMKFARMPVDEISYFPLGMTVLPLPTMVCEPYCPKTVCGSTASKERSGRINMTVVVAGPRWKVREVGCVKVRGKQVINGMIIHADLPRSLL